MDFDPLGGFGTHVAMPDEAVRAARSYMAALPDLAKPRDLDRGYLHVSACAEGTTFAEYTANVRLDGDAWRIVPTHDPRTNGISVFDASSDPPTYAAATWRRNRGAVSVCADGMLGATPSDFGPQGIQMHQTEFVCAAMAALCVRYGIPAQGLSTRMPFDGEPTVMTHAEAADLVGNPPMYDAYGPAADLERWDFLSLVPLPPGVAPTAAMATRTGDGLRARIAQYAADLRA